MSFRSQRQQNSRVRVGAQVEARVESRAVESRAVESRAVENACAYVYLLGLAFVVIMLGAVRV